MPMFNCRVHEKIRNFLMDTGSADGRTEISWGDKAP